jgi:hypothetical protein
MAMAAGAAAAAAAPREAHRAAWRIPRLRLAVVLGEMRPRNIRAPSSGSRLGVARLDADLFGLGAFAANRARPGGKSPATPSNDFGFGRADP